MVAQGEVVIVNRLGLHARAAARFVTVASRFVAEVRVVRGGREVNGKSIMGIMMLAASQGTTLEIIVDGADEEIALKQLSDLVAERFGETE